VQYGGHILNAARPTAATTKMADLAIRSHGQMTSATEQKDLAFGGNGLQKQQ